MKINKIFKDIKACIFDLDGTLVDSMWMWKNIDIEYLNKFGIVCPDDIQIAIEGMSFTETAAYFKQRFMLNDSVDDIKNTWEQMTIEKYRNEVVIKPGAHELISTLYNKGYNLGIATSNGRKMVDVVTNALGISKYFGTIITACEVEFGKPKPDIYLKAAELLNTNPANCLVFEDVPAGIISGKSAGMKVCAVYDDYSKAMKEEKERLADYYIDGFNILLNERLL